jgi:hypothetical protein
MVWCLILLQNVCVSRRLEIVILTQLFKQYKHLFKKNDQRTRAATITHDDHRKSEETDLKPHQQMRKLTGSHKIHRTHESTSPPPTLDAPPKRG